MDKTPAKRMPRPTNSPHVAPRIIGALLAELKKYLADEAKVRAEYPWATRFVMGLPLAPWQREFEWSAEQSSNFVTSVWTGVPLGVYLLTEGNIKPGNEVVYEYLANCVMEGQQRLYSLELYFTDRLAVPDVDGVPTRWRELARQEQMWFEKRIFDCGITPETDEDKLKALYDTLNYGGTPHKEHQRAVRIA